MNTDMHRAAEPEENPVQWADPASVTAVFVYLASDASLGVTGRRFRAQEDWLATVGETGRAETPAHEAPVGEARFVSVAEREG